MPRSCSRCRTSTAGWSAGRRWWRRNSWRSGVRPAPIERFDPMQTLVLVLHILAAVGIVVLVLLQHGKGADMGAAFGSGSAGSPFRSAGASHFLSRTTAVLAAVLFSESPRLISFSAPSKASGVMQPLEAPASTPAVDGKSEVKPASPASSAPAPAGSPPEKSSEV